MKDIDYKQNYEKNWKDIVENDDGSINKEQLIKELSDFSMLIKNTSIVYCHITNNAVSNVLTDPDVVIALADDLT